WREMGAFRRGHISRHLGSEQVNTGRTRSAGSAVIDVRFASWFNQHKEVIEMSNKMTKEKVMAMGASWNTGDPDHVISFFVDDAEYFSSVGDERLGKAFKGKAAIKEGAKRFFQLFPYGKFENATAEVYGDFGTLEWDFVNYDEKG